MNCVPHKLVLPIISLYQAVRNAEILVWFIAMFEVTRFDYYATEEVIKNANELSSKSCQGDLINTSSSTKIMKIYLQNGAYFKSNS